MNVFLLSLEEGAGEPKAPLKNKSLQLIRFILGLNSGLRQQWFQSVFYT